MHGRGTNRGGAPPPKAPMHVELHRSLRQRAEVKFSVSPPGELPVVVAETYHSLLLLPKASARRESCIGLRSSLYKAVSRVDGSVVALRRLHGTPRLAHELFQSALSGWSMLLPHPNIVTLLTITTSRDFDELNDMVFVYDFHAGATTLEARYFPTSPESVVEESVLWSYIVQLSSALCAVHASNRACRIVDASKILLTDEATNRVRINGAGLLDVVQYDTGKKSMPELQYEDLVALGNLILRLACKSHAGNGTLQDSLDFVGKCYSPHLKEVLVYLLSKPAMGQAWPTALSLQANMSGLLAKPSIARIHTLQQRVDNLEEELEKQLDNGRLLRLLVKLGFVNERPEHLGDTTWSETGDRYLLKLFRDYVFHQVDDSEGGKPVLDLAHVIEALNKLDVGSAEQAVLASRDESSIMCVSYKELAACLNEAYGQLRDGI